MAAARSLIVAEICVGLILLAAIAATFSLSVWRPVAPLSRAGIQRLAAHMSSFAVASAERINKGRQSWSPKSDQDWPVYDLTPPSLFHHDLSFDDARAVNGAIPVSNAPIAALKPFVIKPGSDDYNRALQCLTQAIYYEAGFESGEGEEAVAQVVLNRVRHPDYPNTVCGVVYQGSQLATGCQFSFTCDGSLKHEAQAAAWARCQFVAKQALAGFVYEPVGTATHYHANYVYPYWAITLVKLDQIGAHIFYRMTGPEGAADQFTSRYAGGEAFINPAVLSGGDNRTPNAPTVLAPVEPAPRLITLTIGGETKTYAVAGANGAAPSAEAVSQTGVAVSGVIRPGRHVPTREEVKAINDKLLGNSAPEAVPSSSSTTEPPAP